MTILSTTTPCIQRPFWPALAGGILLILATTSHSADLPENANALGEQEIAGAYIAEALRNNPGLLALEKRYQAARASIDAAGALPNPNIQLTHFVESIQTRTGPQRQALMIQQPIPWLSKLNSRRDIAKAQSEMLWHSYASQQFELVERVTTQVFELAFLDKSIAITQENRELLKGLESIVEDRVASGGSLADLLRLQVEIERYDDQLARQMALYEGASAKLEALLGRIPSENTISLHWNPPLNVQIDKPTWLDSILERSTQLAVLRSLDSSQAARERLAKLANRPDFTVGVNYIRTGKYLNATAPDSGTDPWAIMVGVSLPVWQKANNAVALQAGLEQEAIAAQIQDQELQLLADGRASIAKHEDAQQRLSRYDTKLIPLARQARELTLSSYQSGNASILDLIDSDRALLQLETEYWRAAADTWLARWKLATLSGGVWLD